MTSEQVVLSSWSVLRAAEPNSPFLNYAAPNSISGVRPFLCHSLGYFVQDLVRCSLQEPDPTNLLHHVAYLLACSPVALSDRGWAMTVVGTVLAEATGPMQNCWETAKAFSRSTAGPVALTAATVYERMSLPFTLSFVLCGGVLMPIVMFDMARFLYTRSEGNIAMIWAFGLFAVGMCGNWIWLTQLVKGFVKYRRKKNRKAWKDPKDCTRIKDKRSNSD